MRERLEVAGISCYGYGFRIKFQSFVIFLWAAALRVPLVVVLLVVFVDDDPHRNQYL